MTNKKKKNLQEIFLVRIIGTKTNKGPHQKQQTYFKIGRAQSWTGEQTWKNHIYGNSHTAQHISISNLNILDLGHLIEWNFESVNQFKIRKQNK